MIDIKKKISFIAKVKKIEMSKDWVGIDPVIPILNMIKDENAVVVIKFDGERNFNTKNESGPFTVLISNGKLKDNYIKYELWSLEEAVIKAIIEYSDLFWKI